MTFYICRYTIARLGMLCLPHKLDWDGIATTNKIREHQQRTLIMLSRFKLLRGWGSLGVNLLKQENLQLKSFSENVECSKKL